MSKALVKSTNSIPTKAFFLLLLSTSQLGVLKAVLLTFLFYKPIVCCILRNHVISDITCDAGFQLASPQTSFGIRSSRIHFSMRDERTAKDVCREARFHSFSWYTEHRQWSVTCSVFLSSLFERCTDSSYFPLVWWLAGLNNLFKHAREKWGIRHTNLL